MKLFQLYHILLMSATISQEFTTGITLMIILLTYSIKRFIISINNIKATPNQ